LCKSHDDISPIELHMKTTSPSKITVSAGVVLMFWFSSFCVHGANPQCPNPQMSYFGGPVLANVKVVPVFWGSKVNTYVVASMPHFYADITRSSYWSLLHEYDTPTQHIGPGTATAGITIGTVPNTGTQTDAALQTDLVQQVFTFHTLPAPDSNTVYMVHFPPGVTVTRIVGGALYTSCVDFCGYHNSFKSGSNVFVYAVIMDTFTNGCATGCGGNGDPSQNQTYVASHELVDAVADPYVGLNTNNPYAYPCAWADNDNSCGEVGDVCDDNSPGDTILRSGGGTWVVQQIWSGCQGQCSSAASGLPVANNQDLITYQGTPLAITLSELPGCNQYNVFTVTNGPAHGILSGSPPNLTYTPAAEFAGQDSFQFAANGSPGTVSIAVTTSPYAQAVLADHPLGYWRLDETNGLVAHDYVGGNHGVYTNALLGQPGPKFIDAHPAVVFGALATSNSYVGGIPIDFSTTGNAEFSVEAWVAAGPQTSDAGIITKGYSGGGEQFTLDTGSDSGNPGHAFRFFVRNQSGTPYRASSSIAPDGKWHHLVGVCDQSNGVVKLYIDGVTNATGAIPSGSGLLSSASAVTFGAKQLSASSSYNLQFAGTNEEFALYNYALSAAQVRNHFAAASNLPPVFVTNPFTEPGANAGQPYSASIATNATDPVGNPITFSKLSGPSWLSVAGNGALSGTPLSSANGLNSFQVAAADPYGLSNSATMYITVTPAPPILATAARAGSNFSLNWSGGISPYQVQIATNLPAPFWQNLGAPVISPPVSVSPSNRAAFFRILGN
jgi:hypothetical protein